MLSQHIGRAENSAAADFNRLGFVVLRQAIPERAQSDLLIVVRDMIASRAEATGLTDRIGPAPTDVVEFFAHYLPAVDRLDHSIIKLAYDSCFDTIAGRCLFSNTEIIGMCAELLGCDPRIAFVLTLPDQRLSVWAGIRRALMARAGARACSIGARCFGPPTGRTAASRLPWARTVLVILPI